MKSICFFIFDLKTGGAEKVVIYLANYFAEKNKEVILLTVADNNDLGHAAILAMRDAAALIILQIEKSSILK